MPPTDWSITLDIPDPSFGGTVSFTVEAGRMPNAQSDSVWVMNTAYQDGKLVYAQYHGYFDGYYAGPDPDFTLGPTRSWSGGPAQGVAEVGYYRRGEFRAMAEVEYEIAG